MTKKILFTFATLMALNIHSFSESVMAFERIATPTPSYKPIVKKVGFNKICFGATHDPHYSSHVPGTINVVSETGCPGKQVSVQTILFLGSLEAKHIFITSGFTSHRDRAELSTSWPCHIGHTYIITAVSYHVDDRGHGVETVNRATVYCGKIVIPKITPTVKPKK